MKNVNWKMKGFAKNVDPELAVKEIERIKELYGSITPENIVAEAQKEECALHALFEWDDTKAAAQYRLQQARILINNISITVIQNGQSKEVGAYEIVTVGAGREYKSVDTMTKQDIKEVKKNVLREIGYLKSKLAFFSELRPAVEHLENAEDALRKP